MMISATQIRSGTLLIYNRELHRAHEVIHKTPGNLRGFVQVKMRNLRNGAMIEHRFGSTDRVEKASLDEREMEYLYSDAAGHHFMDSESYEQLTIPESMLAEALRWMKDSEQVDLLYIDDSPADVQLPSTIDLAVSQAEPG